MLRSINSVVAMITIPTFWKCKIAIRKWKINEISTLVVVFLPQSS